MTQQPGQDSENLQQIHQGWQYQQPQTPQQPQQVMWTAPTPPNGPVSIEQFEPPHRKRQLLLALVAAALAVGLLLWGISRVLKDEIPLPSSTSTHSKTPNANTAKPRTATTTNTQGRSLAWVDKKTDSAGTWEILEEKWEGNTVIVKVKISSTKGTIHPRFFIISNANSSKQYLPDTSATAQRPSLEDAGLDAGTSLTGYLTFHTEERSAATLIFGSTTKNATSGLLLNG
ncbi:MAG: hypothetical protein ACRDAX_06310 [Propionibacteriaceae bacterium]